MSFMLEELYEKIDDINQEHNLEISLDTIAEIYGNDVVDTMAQMYWDVVANIEHLISLGFGEDVSDICNRYGILLSYSTEFFCDQVSKLVCSIGENYVEKMGEDMSCWESIM
jgi:hypothetical protein